MTDSAEHQISTHFNKENCPRSQASGYSVASAQFGNSVNRLCLEQQQHLSLVLSYKKSNSVGDTEVKATVK